jgi:hypothetical protein
LRLLIAFANWIKGEILMNIPMTIPMEPKYVAYFRVSTQKQGRSGLGLDAQKQAVKTFQQFCSVNSTQLVNATLYLDKLLSYHQQF